MSGPFTALRIGQELDRFASFLDEREYSERTIDSYRAYVTRFLGSGYHTEGSDLRGQIEEFLIHEDLSGQCDFKGRRASLRAYFRFVMQAPYPKTRTEESFGEVEELLEGFRRFQRTVKFMAEANVASEANRVRPFLVWVYKKLPKGLPNIRAKDIRDYLISETAHLRPSTKARLATLIRNFFRYLEFTEASVDPSIVKLQLSPTTYSDSVVPTVLEDEALESLENCFDRDQPAGIRDYAIAQCFLQTGIRCSEVADLSLDDFEWSNGLVHIRNTKTRVDRVLPVSSTLGEAIVAYVRDSRPESASRTLFLRFRHNRGEPMGTEQIRGAMRRAYKKAGIPESITGTHILRRTVATKIYRNGSSLKAVADVLGHESLESTTRYTKVDTGMLAHAAGAWPGGGDS